MTNKGYAHTFAYVLPDFVTFLLRPNTALDHQTFHAEPQSLLSRGDDTCERLRSLRDLWSLEKKLSQDVFSRQAAKVAKTLMPVLTP